MIELNKSRDNKGKFIKGHKSKFTKEEKDRRSTNSLGEKNSFYGKKHKAETKENWSKKRKGIDSWNKGKNLPKEQYPNFGFRTVRKYQIFPKEDTSIEIKIQDYLKELKIGFFTHYYCKEIEHAYQCDIFIPVQKSNTFFIKQPIIIECDGDYWHDYPKGKDIDKIRTQELIKKGFKVIRLWEREIKKIEISKLKEMLL